VLQAKKELNSTGVIWIIGNFHYSR